MPTPDYQIVDDLSQQQQVPHSPLHPRARPPTSAPPPPPCGTNNPFDDKNNNDMIFPPSYQKDDDNNGSRAVAPPTIRHDDENNSLNHHSSYYWRNRWWGGNAALNPNRGLTNSYDTANCPPPHGIVRHVRIATVLLSALTCWITGWTWWIRFLFLQWTVMVISVYLGFLALLLCVSELVVIVSTQQQQQQQQSLSVDHMITGSVHALLAPPPGVRRLLQDQFGFLYHPTGKLLLLILMATMCFAVRGFWEFFLGFGYMIVAVVIGVLSNDVNFCRLYYPLDTTTTTALDAPVEPRVSQSWSHYSSRRHHDANALSESMPADMLSETASLMQNVQSVFRPHMSV